MSVLRDVRKRNPTAVHSSYITHFDCGNMLYRYIDSILYALPSTDIVIWVLPNFSAYISMTHKALCSNGIRVSFYATHHIAWGMPRTNKFESASKPLTQSKSQDISCVDAAVTFPSASFLGWRSKRKLWCSSSSSSSSRKLYLLFCNEVPEGGALRPGHHLLLLSAWPSQSGIAGCPRLCWKERLPTGMGHWVF